MAAGAVEIAPRRRLKLQEGRLADMAASDLELGYAGVKAYGATAQGAAFVVALFATDRPELVALIEADHLGRLRTGAASGVAAKHLAREGASSLGVIGCGTQAETQVTCIRAAVPTIERVVAYCRTERNLEAFCKLVAAERAESNREAAEQDVVVTITSSRDPVLRGEWLRPGAFVCAGGANKPSSRELDNVVLERASFVCCDWKVQARIESADLIDRFNTVCSTGSRCTSSTRSYRVSCREGSRRTTSSCSSRMESPRGTWRSQPRQSTVRASVALGSRSSCARFRDRGGCPRRSRHRAPGSAPAGRAGADAVAG